MNTKTLVALSVGTMAMLILILILMLRYKVKAWKSIPVAVILTVTGTLSTYVWFFVEASWWGGRSYYGAVFLVPVAFLIIAKIMSVPYKELMDFCAPAECVMLAIMKYQCFIDGCCGGMILNVAENGDITYFPSQIVELCNALLLMIVLMILAFQSKHRGKIYGWYLLLYGVSRFILNWFRESNEPLIMGLPDGNVWSLLAIFIGLLWLFDLRITIVKANKIES